MADTELERLREILIAIRDYGTDEEDGYPAEICYDEFAYKRIVDSYRKAAIAGVGERDDQTKTQTS